MMNKIQKAQQQTENKVVVVMCKLALSVFLVRCFHEIKTMFSSSDGVHRSGTFCAIGIIVETLKTEQIVDIFQVVKAIRLHNPDYVTDLVSQTFCPCCPVRQ